MNGLKAVNLRPGKGLYMDSIVTQPCLPKAGMLVKVTTAGNKKRNMLDKLDAIKAKFDNLGVALTNPEIVRDIKR